VLNLAIALFLAAAMLITLRWCWNGDTWGVVTLILLCMVWLLVDKAFEGPHVVRLAETHALVLADVFAIIVGASGVIGWLRALRPFDRTNSRRSSLPDQAVGDRE
jgi:hypothetical protein